MKMPRSSRVLAGTATLLTTLMLVGCVVTSIYPFYTAQDVSFDPALMGTWHDAEQTNSTWVFEKVAEQTYQLTTRDNSETNEFDTHLFTLAGVKFLDCLSRQRSAYATPNHILMRIRQTEPELQVVLLNYEWLGELLEKNPKTLAHVITPAPAGSSGPDKLLTLTADTAALQKFVRKHLNNTNAWSEMIGLKKI